MTPQNLVERALDLSRADGCVAIVRESTSTNLRWAGNTLTTNGLTRGRSVTVIAVVEGPGGTSAGSVSTSSVTPESLAEVVAAAERAARDNGPAEDAAPLVPGGEGPGWDSPPAEPSTDVVAAVAPGLGAAFDAAGAAGHLLYGYAEHSVESTYLGSSTGLRRHHRAPSGQLELTGRSADGERSAWAGQSLRAPADADVAALASEVGQRLDWARRRVQLPAGRYETLLPPSAVADLMIYLHWSAGALDAAEGRTVFSRPGGGTRIGERLSPLPLTLRSDPALPGHELADFVIAGASSRLSSVFDNGLALPAIDWIRDGQLSALLGTRHSAAVTGLPVTPFVGNLALEGADPGQAAVASSRAAPALPAQPDLPALAAMVASTQRGLLLTCLWYIRAVDPQTLLLTGLTRDGVFLVEGGEVVGAVNNFRFNESPVALLGRVTEVGQSQATLPREFGDHFSDAIMPPLRVPDFLMSSVSEAS